jgi:photosystem II stability/assembly factor-like uncharacterized protein
MQSINPGLKRMLIRSVPALFVLLASCLFETRDAQPDRPGFLNLELRLRPNANALLKSSSDDTVFNLDSVVIRLSADGAAAQRYSYPISGRSDTGNITVSAKVLSLPALRTWKAVILTIDTTLYPVRRDTVHRDSVSFTINPGDTAFVSKTVNAAYAILRARLVSTSAASLAHNVKYVRIKVDGTSRDSMQVGPVLRAVRFGNASNGGAVGDSGTLLTTVNKGANWTAVSSGTTAHLYGINFPAATAAWAVGSGGKVLKTSTLTAWSSVTSGTTVDLNATYFTGASNGWIVGDEGVIRKTTNGTSFSAQTSGTARNLNAIHMTTASNGNVVGDGGTILRTTTGGTTWSPQTSGTTRNLRGIAFSSGTAGIAIGDSGTILTTSNSGATWTAVTSGTNRNLNGIFLTTNNTGYIAGEGGILMSSTDGINWTVRESGTGLDLYGVAWTTNTTGGAVVGDKGSVSIAVTEASWTFQPFGTKLFDVFLTYKYFTPNVSHSLTMDAIDTLSGTLRGYQAVKTVLLAPGKDTTVTPNSSLAQCGYGGVTPACN